MTNKEKAKEYAASKHTSDILQEIVALDFLAGAEWKEQQMMEMFRDFLNEIGRGQQFGRFEREMKGKEDK